MKKLTYAETLRWKMKSGDAPGGARFSIRDLSKLSGYCYEHIRKIIRGQPVVSEELNGQLCEILGLDKDEMWRQATKEKLSMRFPDIPMMDLLPDDPRVRDVWPNLTTDQRERLITIASGWVEENRIAASQMRSRDKKVGAA